MAYNLDELVAPAWLNDEFFRDVMRDANHDPTIELTEKCVLRPGTNMGDHYASVMYRTTVRYRSANSDADQSVNLIMKTAPEAEGMKKQLLDDNMLFDIEIRMYSTVLPEMARLLAEIGEVFKYPRYFYGKLEPHSILILEDISNQGWVMGDYIETVDDMKPIIRDIARFHAASVMIESKDPKFSTENYCSLAEKLMTFDQLINKGFDDFMYLTETYPEFAQFAKPLQNFKRDLRATLDAAYTPSSTFQNVLNHGDLQCKNMLHQVDAQGRHTDTILLDYQACTWISPAIDLIRMLDMVASQAMKNSVRNELIYLYHRQYSDLLQRMGFAGHIPSLLELQIELLRCAGLEMFHHVAFGSYRCLESENVDLDAFLKGEIDNPALNKPEFKKLMHAELSRFLYQGTLSNV